MFDSAEVRSRILQRSETNSYTQKREQSRKRQAGLSQTGRDIGSIPLIANPQRREACRLDLRLFLETYLPDVFNLEWSPIHLTAISRLETAILRDAMFALAMPRGGGKSSLCRGGALWATSYAHCRYPFLIGATGGKAEESLDAIKIMMRFSETYVEDFPEISFPINALGGIANRASGQLCEGKPTLIQWGKDRVVLPTVPQPSNIISYEGLRSDGKANTSGTVIGVTGLTGEGLRGSLHMTLTGEQVRPDFVLLDDPQTDDSAASPSQNRKRERLINGTVMGLAGPDKGLSLVMPCTVIYKDDMVDRILDRKQNPLWRGERYPLLFSMPKDMDAWDQYREIYEKCMGQEEPDLTEANNYYLQHRKHLDEGSLASWEGRKKPNEISAIQSAMNLYYKVGPESFASEYQNNPLDNEENEDVLTADEIATHTNGVKRGVVPLNCDTLTCFIDVQKACLWWCVCAWGEGFKGAIVDYGAWPDQKRTYFTLRDIRKTIARAKPGIGFEAQLEHALNTCTNELMERIFIREADGAEMQIKQLMIDAAWGESTAIVRQVARRSKHKANIIPSFGRGITADRVPISQYKVKAGERLGVEWYVTTSQKTRGDRHIIHDSNWWKSFTHRRIAHDPAEKSSLSLFGNKSTTHRMISEHLSAEAPISTQGNGRQVNVWKLKPNRDNHLADCVVGCAVAASLIGVTAPGHQATPTRKRKRKKATVNF